MPSPQKTSQLFCRPQKTTTLKKSPKPRNEAPRWDLGRPILRTHRIVRHHHDLSDGSGWGVLGKHANLNNKPPGRFLGSIFPELTKKGCFRYLILTSHVLLRDSWDKAGQKVWPDLNGATQSNILFCPYILTIRFNFQHLQRFAKIETLGCGALKNRPPLKPFIKTISFFSFLAHERTHS